LTIPVLDAFILSLLDRGAESSYDLHRLAGVSLGASTPSLLRLAKQKLVVREKSPSSGKRTRYAFRLTAAGAKTARTAWKEQLCNDRRTFDIDSTLRIADMAFHYGAPRKALMSFLRLAGTERLKLAEDAATAAKNKCKSTKFSYPALRARCEAQRLRAEAEVLLMASDSFKRGSDPVEGQRSLL
jgi:DNA-binding PadR family transcriptional regulator